MVNVLEISVFISQTLGKIQMSMIWYIFEKILNEKYETINIVKAYLYVKKLTDRCYITQWVIYATFKICIYLHMSE